MCHQLGPGAGIRVLLSGRSTNLDRMQVLEEFALSVAGVDGIELSGRAPIGEVGQYGIGALRQHVRQPTGMRQKMADADRLAVVLQVGIVTLQVLPDVVIQADPALQDSIRCQRACQRLAQ